jgi:uncharacterized protein YjbI with pentapeptide repeats
LQLAVDFMSADLTGAVFLIICDLYRAEFEKAIANKTDLEAVIITRLTLQRTKLKSTIFSHRFKRLLAKHDIIVQ